MNRIDFVALFGHRVLSGELLFFQHDPQRDPGPCDNAWRLGLALERFRPNRPESHRRYPFLHTGTMRVSTARKERWNDRPF